MKHYRELLLRALLDSGWEIMERTESDEWWLEESWRIRSIRQHWGQELFILFLVDPMDERVGAPRSVWAIAAFAELPSRRPLHEGIATIPLQKGRFDAHLRSLISEIERHRNSTHSC